MTKVNNVPAYASEYRYLVCRECDGELWFYGAWDELEKASGVARDVHGIVVEQN